MDFKIRPYRKSDFDSVAELFGDFQDFIVKIDSLKRCTRSKVYGKLYADLIIRRTGKNRGFLFLAESYFKSKNCDVVRVDVFSPNTLAHEFYRKFGYCDRIVDMIKIV